ncbi:MAG: hypothetical protein LBM69_04530, partial [Lachnospiraceae bacterium]|nr:hypothetical protein [Lachnospiraceae bacterium]
MGVRLSAVTVHIFVDLRFKGNVSRTNRTEPGGVLGVRLSGRSDEPRTVKMRAQASDILHLDKSPQNEKHQKPPPALCGSVYRLAINEDRRTRESMSFTLG